MPGFTQVFGGTTIAPANATFLSLTMASSVVLAWPIEQAVNGNVVADTIEVNATAPGLNVDIPDARQVSTGYTTCFNNVGANTVSVRNVVGATILSLVPGSAWVIYLADNSTQAGVWRVFQLGASVSVAVAAALAGAGLRAIVTTLNQDIPVTSFNTTPTSLLDTDRAKFMNWTGGLGALNLPSAGAVGNGWFVQVRNSGSGDLTVTPPAGTIDGAANKTFAAGASATIVTDGNNYITLGFGSGSGGGGGGGFDFVEINVAGSGDFVLAGANLNRIAYRFIGVLTGNRNIIVPNAIQQYWIANATTGAFSLFVKTVGQAPPGIEVLQNNQSIMYCDGTNVIDAESSTVSFPIPVAQGGTGAVNASGARTNLGATATGAAVFTAATQADARTAIDCPPNARAINTQHSLTGGGNLSADRTLNLVGDVASPGNNFLYSTNPSGTRGWHNSTLNLQLNSLGVGTAPGVAGEIRATNDVTAFFSSDAVLKMNVRSIPDALQKLLQLRGVLFDWTPEYLAERGGEDGYFVRRADVGVIAQEVQRVLPEVVGEREDGYLAVKYDRIVALLIEAVKELAAGR